MSNSFKQSQDFSRKRKKADPFAIADLDSLADEMLHLLAEASLDRDSLIDVARKIKEAAESVTLFVIDAGLAEEPGGAQ